MKTPLEFLAEELEIDPDELRDIARVMRSRRQGKCEHEWVLTWPNDPEEWECKKCFQKGTR